LIFSAMRSNLLEELRRRIHNGEFTERSLARRLGVSQPHVHNVLAGVRTLSIEMADHIVAHLEIPLAKLLPAQDGQPMSRIISSIQR
jgi:transcriptional regulator with XRE-family HTH domain